MHILITGATGFVGRHVLFDALVDNRVTKVTVVGRHPPSLDEKHLDAAKSAIIQKLNIITREDLSVWDYEQDTELVSALADCRACIWCVGGKADNFSSPEEFERVSYTFTLNAAHFLSKLAHAQSTTHAGQGGFRFCYCSAKWANRATNANQGLFSIEAETRHMKGRVEVALLSVAAESHGTFVAYIFRPGALIAPKSLASFGGLASSVASAGFRIMPSLVANVDSVARVLVDASVGVRVEWQRQGPDGDKDTWESEEIVSWSMGLGA